MKNKNLTTNPDKTTTTTHHHPKRAATEQPSWHMSRINHQNNPTNNTNPTPQKAESSQRH
jgi:hypothetical protein